ncbi:Fmu (Sun) domain-containing protein [Niastella yeongjuensis]|uniref:Fmu (Sun) domain-containing protein n=1 Tax=Niastella yeongjuensis TaxID=354355 RepID=A0A1V9EYY7_9BACT|nr:Fmu (Sun) domain-containing protein [Niastella yeongjuensis]OQP51337.1 Fmu (Sun) domain-containing protein [Niastella yeongjuensis]SEP38712.1 16S rRNA (cytosine967-C5)-methyltransferase [Niastella yeongjuensis]
MKYFSHLNTAVQLLQQYNGSQPFGSFIKQFFSQHKKYGSKDRKNISHLCYAFFRLGKALPQLPMEERILTGLFLCSPEPNDLLQHLRPDWNDKAHLPLLEKTALVALHLPELFPWAAALSEGMVYEPFCASFLTQPDLFLRLRPGKEAAVKNKLQQAGITFRELNRSCLALPNASKIDTLIETDREAVIQDYSSQRIGELMELIRDAARSAAPLKVWDACAASGGKSILANDIFHRIDLTVSDVRKSILINLEKRFATAGIKNYHSFIADLSAPNLKTRNTLYDVIITDVPCSGSGTWSRTPEQLYYFDPQQIDRYSTLQKKIVEQAIPHLKPGGFLLYCTCSVFKKENEEVVQYIQEQHSLSLLKTALFTGYDQKADTLFGAVFQKK